MVVFTCNNCGDSLQKPKVAKHYQFQCRNPTSLTCVDCLKDFLNDEYVAHTKCITEAERYGGKDFVPKPSANKGEKKQQEWINIVHNVLNSSENLSKDERNFLQSISKNQNIPRKKAKYLNFIKNALGYKVNFHIVESCWEKMESAYKEITDSQKHSQNRHKNNGSIISTNNNNYSDNNSNSNNVNNKTENLNNLNNGIEKNKKKNSENEEISKREKKQNKVAEKNLTKKKKSKNEKEEQTNKNKKRDNEETDEIQSKSKSKKRKLNISKAPENGFFVGSVNEITQLKESEEMLLKNEVNIENGEKNEDNQHLCKESKKFNWKSEILQSFESRKEIPLKKLKKRVIRKYLSEHLDAPEDKIESRFNKKLNKVSQLVVIDNKVKLKL